MNNRNDKWVRRFLVSDPTLHDKQFTIYKVTSVVFPRGIPEAATKVVIWKRYSDFKKLHDEMKLLCRHLKIQNFPRLEKTTFFKRFDPQVIENRRKTILTMLEFIADNPSLFTSDLFTNFLQGNNYMISHDSSVNDSSSEPTHPRNFDVDKYPNDSASHCSTDSRCSSAVDNDSAIYSSILSVDVPFIDSPPDSVTHFKIDAKESSYHPKLSADSLLSNPSVDSVPSYTVFENLSDKKCKTVPSPFDFGGKIQDVQDQEKLSESVSNSNQFPSANEAASKHVSSGEQTHHKQTSRLAGICRFIGELFKLNLLETSIVHSTMSELVRTAEDEALEVLCILLTTVSRYYRSRIENRNQSLVPILVELDRFACANRNESPKISTRIKRMIHNVLIELG